MSDWKVIASKALMTGANTDLMPSNNVEKEEMDRTEQKISTQNARLDKKRITYLQLNS